MKNGKKDSKKAKLLAENERLREENASFRREFTRLTRDIKPIHDLFQGEAPCVIAAWWGRNVCEWAAQEIIRLRDPERDKVR